jgi:hypothetical protein
MVVVGPVWVRLEAQPLSLHGEATLKPLISESEGLPRFLASPTCGSWNQLGRWLRAVEGLRRAA